eukprot:1914975-Prymnesium_polylepis.1
MGRDERGRDDLPVAEQLPNWRLEQPQREEGECVHDEVDGGGSGVGEKQRGRVDGAQRASHGAQRPQPPSLSETAQG